MKEIKTEIQKTEYRISYEAIDGEVFDDLKACEEYEKSYRCITRSKLKRIQIGEAHNAWELMGGYEDNEVIAVKPSVDIIMAALYADCPWLRNDNYAEKNQKIIETIEFAAKKGDMILLGINDEGNYYFINSRNNIVLNLQSLGEHVQ